MSLTRTRPRVAAAAVRCDAGALVPCVFSELLGHASALVTDLAASLAAGAFCGAVAVEARALTRTALLANLEKLEHAKARVAELTGVPAEAAAAKAAAFSWT